MKPPRAGMGRPKGAKNKVTGAVKDMVLQALGNAGGVDYLEKQARENPTAFLSLVGKIIPTQVTGELKAALQVITGVPRDGDH